MNEEVGEAVAEVVYTAWDFAIPAGLIVGTIVVAVVLHAAIYRWLRRRQSETLRDAALRFRRPARQALILLTFVLVLPNVDLDAEWSGIARHVAGVLLILLFGTTALSLLEYLTDRKMREQDLGDEDNARGRRVVTQMRVLKGTSRLVIVLLTAGAVLITFEGVREFGVSILAAGGAAGLVLGFAARPVLANLIAGIQIALTQPMKIEDVVIVEGEWGWIEEITATYVVVRIWDWRRLVVPLSHFIETPFQNWTRENGSIIGAVTWHVDYTVPMSAFRAKVEEVVRAQPLWDGKVVNMQVLEAGPDTVTLRGLMSARSAPRAWDLRCAVREAMIEWLQREHPQALPRHRSELVGETEGERSLAGTRAARVLG